MTGSPFLLIFDDFLLTKALQVFCLLLDAFLMIKWGLCILGRVTTEMNFHSHDITLVHVGDT